MLGPTITPQELAAIPKGPLSPADVAALRARGWSVEPTERKTTYRTNWTLWHALREAAQNSIDAAGRVEIVVDDTVDPPCTFVSDDGAGFDLDALFMGERKGVVGADTASQREAARQKHCLRGRYGEGMKLGVLPVLQAGGSVLIRTTGLDATFVEGDYETAGRTVRIILRLVRPNGVARGTTVGILGLDATKWRDTSKPDAATPVVDMRMRALPTLAEVAPQAILLTSRTVPGDSADARAVEPFADCKIRHLLDLPGHVFVRDIWVERRDDFIFGYNFWFEDTLQALGGDRDRLQVGSQSHLLAHEFAMLLRRMPPETLAAWLDRVLVHDRDAPDAAKQRGFAEYGALDDEHALLRGTTVVGADFPKRALDAIRAVLRIRPGIECAWSTVSAERDELVHRGVADLTGRVPDGFRVLLEREHLVRPAAAIVGATAKAARWTIEYPQLARFLAATLELRPEWNRDAPEWNGSDRYVFPEMVSDARRKLAHMLIAPLRASQRLLTDAANWMFGKAGMSGIAAAATVSFYVPDPDAPDADLPKHGGIWSPTARTISIALGALALGTDDVIDVFLHEMGHALSNNAPDKSDAHAAGIAAAGRLASAWTRANPRAHDRLLKALGASDPGLGDFRLRWKDESSPYGIPSAWRFVWTWALERGLVRKQRRAATGDAP